MKTIRLLSTYNGYKPNDIITVEDTVASQLLPYNATLDLTGGTPAYQQAPNGGVSTGTNLPADQNLVGGQTVTLVLPANTSLAVAGSSDIAGTREVLNPDNSVASSQPLQSGNSTIGVFLVDTRVRFNVTFGTLTTRAGVVAGATDGAPLYTSSATLGYGEDRRGFNKNIEAANTPVQVKRIPSATAGTFLNNGDVNVTPTGAPGNAGDYLRSVVVEVKTVAAGGKASVFLTQRGDNVFVDSTTAGAVIGGTNSQAFTSGPALTATANQLADRVISFQYIPTGGQLQWFTTRIVSHAAISTNTPTFVLEDTPEAGAAPVRWIVHGSQARRLVEPGRAEGVHTIDVRRASQTGGYVAWLGNGVVSADFFVVTG